MLPRVPAALTSCSDVKELRWEGLGKKKMSSKRQVSCSAEVGDQMFSVCGELSGVGVRCLDSPPLSERKKINGA